MIIMDNNGWNISNFTKHKPKHWGCFVALALLALPHYGRFIGIYNTIGPDSLWRLGVVIVPIIWHIVLILPTNNKGNIIRGVIWCGYNKEFHDNMEFWSWTLLGYNKWDQWHNFLKDSPILTNQLIIISGWWFQPHWNIWNSVGMIIPNIWKNKKKNTNQIFIYSSWSFSLFCPLVNK